MNATVAECERPPLVPATITFAIPVDVKVQESVLLPEPVTLVGASVHEVLLETRLTIPENPF